MVKKNFLFRDFIIPEKCRTFAAAVTSWRHSNHHFINPGGLSSTFLPQRQNHL